MISNQSHYLVYIFTFLLISSVFGHDLMLNKMAMYTFVIAFGCH